MKFKQMYSIYKIVLQLVVVEWEKCPPLAEVDSDEIGRRRWTNRDELSS